VPAAFGDSAFRRRCDWSIGGAVELLAPMRPRRHARCGGLPRCPPWSRPLLPRSHPSAAGRAHPRRLRRALRPPAEV